MRLLLFVGLLAVSTFAAIDVANKDLGELLKELNEVDDSLDVLIGKEKFQAELAKQDLKDAAEIEFERRVEIAKKKAREAREQYEAKKDEFYAQLDAKRQEALDQAKAKLKEHRDVKKQEREEAKQRYEQLLVKFKDQINKRKVAKEEQRKALADYIKKVEDTIQDNRITRAEEKKQRLTERQAARDQFIEDYKSQREALANEQKELAKQVHDLSKREDELQKSLKDAFGNTIKQNFKDALEDYLEDKLELEVAVAGAAESIKGAATAGPSQGVHVEGDIKKQPGHKPEIENVKVDPRASLVDTLTGKSSWETVTWVLLVLCILLAVALIAIILYQVVNKQKEYEKLDGRNDGPQGNEQSGLLVGSPKGGAYDSSLPPPAVPVTAGPLVPASAPAAPPSEAHQQF